MGAAALLEGAPRKGILSRAFPQPVPGGQDIAGVSAGFLTELKNKPSVYCEAEAMEAVAL